MVPTERLVFACRQTQTNVNAIAKPKIPYLMESVLNWLRYKWIIRMMLYPKPFPRSFASQQNLLTFNDNIFIVMASYAFPHLSHTGF